MPKRIKRKPGRTIETREQMAILVGEIAQLQLLQNELKVKMDTEIAAIQEKYSPKIVELDKQINEEVLVAEDWAGANPEEFAGKKSIDFVSAIVGFRTGTPKVKKRGKKFGTLQDIAYYMLGTRWAKKYVKTPAPTVNKEALIADRGILTAEQLIELGIQIVQDETFYIQPKQEELTQGVAV